MVFFNAAPAVLEPRNPVPEISRRPGSCDLQPTQCRLCLRLGADLVIDYTRENILSALRAWAPTYRHRIDAIASTATREMPEIVKRAERWYALRI